MNLLYCIEPFVEDLSSKKHDLNIQQNYDIHTIGDLTYSCKSVIIPFWLQLIQIENINHNSNEPKIELAFANYNVDYAVKGRDEGIIFSFYLGRP